MEFSARKRGRPAAGMNGNAGFKKSKQDTDSFQSGLGSKSKPCTKFFSTSGCPFGEGCHFSHYVPGGIKAISQMTGSNPALPPTVRNSVVPPPSYPDGSSPPAVKSRLCSKYNTAEGCRFGDKCHYAHGEWELGKPTVPSQHPDSRAMGPAPGNRFASGAPRMDYNSEANQPAPGGFGSSTTSKIGVNAALAGPIIGKNGIHSKQICRTTGVKLHIRDHESDTNLKNIELEGTFDQVKQAYQMVRELIVNLSASSGPPPPQKGSGKPGGPAGNFKTKLCENFTKGNCTFGDRCHFAHGAEELRSSGA
uniref:zinc finger CCCH domain-containing protein 14-like n=1 Tax=Erigeron canadensis TaxID=72917 RepID=UPI001CB9B4BC|nr:zinc finger CCCH domain-containing protein 14-like [Erigeron canadensis]